MNISFAERADQLTDKLREIEHQSEDGDALFYCAYIMGLLGLHSSKEGEGSALFDTYFQEELEATIEAEGLTEQDGDAIRALWQKVIA